MRHIVGILGTPIDNLSAEATMERLDQFILEGRFHQVATANTDFLINALSDPELRHILRGCDLVMPDGMPVVWAAKLMRSPLPERVTGADIVPGLAALAARKGYGIYMLGARPEVAARAKARLESDYPGIRIVGCASPNVGSLVEMDSGPLLDDILRARPQILLVAFGNPKQEKWIYLHRDRLRDVPLCIGVGGTFDFLAGETSRAPMWMQQGGLEWLYRLVREPKRLWRRYARDGWHFSRYLFWQWWVLRGQADGEPAQIYSVQVGEYTVLSAVGNLNRYCLPQFRDAAEEALNANTHIILDLNGVSSIDSEALGTLINLPKRAAYCGREMRLISAPRRIEEALRQSRMQDDIYIPAGSVAQAFSNGHRRGLTAYMKCGQSLATVTANGAADRASVQVLERICSEALSSGKSVDLDARGVTFVDSYLLALLCKLHTRAAESGLAFRIVPSDTLRRAISRDKIQTQFDFRDVPGALEASSQ